jgi:hypothetical protein
MSDAQDRHDQENQQGGSPPPGPGATFDAQYRSLVRAPFAELADKDLRTGGDGVAQAHSYAELGKPDYVLAYLLASDLPDAEKREIFAHAHERRAALTEQRARQFSRQFNRPFPLLFTDAATDRALARRIRSGQPVKRGTGRHVPTL